MSTRLRYFGVHEVSSGRCCPAHQNGEGAGEDPQSVGAGARASSPASSEPRLNRMLRVRHETHHVARGIADARDIVDRAVGIDP